MNKTFISRGIATLSGGVNISATVATLAAASSGLLDVTVSDPPINAVIWDYTTYPAGPHADPNAEDVLITAASGTSITAMTRAQEGSAAAAHNTSGKTYKLLFGYPSKSDMNFIRLLLPTTNAGSPEGVVDGRPGRTCYDTTNAITYTKTTAAGTLTGWV